MNTGKKICYTCITGEKDNLKEQPISTEYKYVCFTDRLNLNSNTWELRPLDIRFIDNNPRRTSRYHKLNPHKLFPDADMTLWVDGSIQLKYPPEFYEQFLWGSDMALLPSPYRTCTYQEATTCITNGLDHRDVIKKQGDRYKDEGFPSNMGMIGTGVLLRSKYLHKFNEDWYKEVKENSLRDQISFKYVCWKHKLLHGIIPLETINIIGHKHRR